MPTSIAPLDGRGVLRLSGSDAHGFLQGIVTTDIDDLVEGIASAGALLTPQGKIIADFLILATGGAYLLDLPRAAFADAQKRFTLYKLRSQVTIEDVSVDCPVFAAWGEEPPAGGLVAKDGRHPGLGWRLYGPAKANATAADYDALRVSLGIAEGGTDFAFNDAVPHDAGFDATGALDFKKGCFVGQEVVSRMKHRGTARKRPVVVTADSDLPATGAPLTVEGREIGTLGTVCGASGLAIVRLDRAREAIDAGTPILVGDVPVTLSLPAYATWTWPETAGQ